MDYGYLIVNTRTALGALPVGGAQVHVVGADTDVKVTTDRSGASERIRLPAPPKERSMTSTPDGLPYSLYDITVSAPGFYTVNSRSVPIFPEVVSIQNIHMIPVAGYGLQNRPEAALNLEGSTPYGLEGEKHDG